MVSRHPKRSYISIKRHEKGQVLILFAVLVTAGALILALVVDAGVALVANLQLQTAVDAAVIAGANEATVVGDAGGARYELTPSAHTEAVRILQRNLVSMGLSERGVSVTNVAVTLSGDTVELSIEATITTYLIGPLYQAITGDPRFRALVIRRSGTAQVVEEKGG